ncbi:MAG: helix-turn-helix domain-containing protein [Firmicutes bacterium]|nr:helix-turn-helix domain-containing protein [Bacillota bacterium]
MGIGKRIKKKLKEEHKSQKEVADKTDVSKSYLHAVKQEQVRPSLRFVARAAKALHTSVDYLLKGRKK